VISKQLWLAIFLISTEVAGDFLKVVRRSIHPNGFIVHWPMLEQPHKRVPFTHMMLSSK